MDGNPTGPTRVKSGNPSSGWKSQWFRAQLGPIFIYIYIFFVCLCFYRLNITFRTQIWTLNTLCTLHVVNFFFILFIFFVYFFFWLYITSRTDIWTKNTLCTLHVLSEHHKKIKKNLIFFLKIEFFKSAVLFFGATYSENKKCSENLLE